MNYWSTFGGGGVMIELVSDLQLADEVTMKLKGVIHQEEEGGYWAEVSSIPRCATQGASFEELVTNLYKAAGYQTPVLCTSLELMEE